ncbi:uncharacterized protein LOC126371309 [Pectinophora gossypiella]|uniref:uncharacterized protein LOC126371309 n=1 Tax=Pectinophora gossypiella TaxID=13191 RepID=UPI00214E24C0|nr:uncharacterized protein LOC126371309 [Pectinophora gossypiella]
MEMYFQANSIDDEMRLPTLIAVIGEEAYDLLSSLASPKKPKELSYDQVTEIMKNHLEPKPSFMAERYRFRQRRQQEGESITHYLTELKKLAKFCDFGETLEDNLRDQFTCCLQNEIIRQRLFAEENLTYKKAVSLAFSLEAAERDAAMVHRSSVSDTNVIGREGAGAGQAAAAGIPIHSFTTTLARRGLRNKGGGNTSRSHYNTMACKSCGGGHRGEECRYKKFTCSKCGQVGHLRRVCPARALSNQHGGSGGGGSRRALHHVQAENCETPEDGDDSTSEIEEEMNHLCLNGYRPV